MNSAPWKYVHWVGNFSDSAELPVADGDRPERRTEQRRAAAEGDAGDQHDRGRCVDVRRRDDAGERDEHGTTPMLAMTAATTNGHELDVGRVVAEEADPFLGIAGGDQQLPVAAAVQLPQHQQEHDHADRPR